MQRRPSAGPGGESRIRNGASRSGYAPRIGLWAWLLIGLGASLVVYAAFVTVLLLGGRRSDARDLAGFIPDCAVLCARLIRDPRVPRRHKALLFALAGYLAMPFDLVPDFLPVVGQLDDVIFTAVVLRMVIRSSGGTMTREHWPGPEQSLTLVLRLGGVAGSRT